ncbi:hypothetical protein DFJ74DRAFT_423744 [Hyaloraphidium curvatum]|nr:hypothetical protein DFJ74DRAFT_423744 [Hyaloraphidium curvatum]
MTQRVACDLPAGPEGSATSRGQRSSRDSTALPRTHRTWPATSLAVLPPLLFALLIPATVAHHGWSGQTELVDPNSGFVVCRQFSGSDYGGGSVSQCIGRCAGGSYTGYGRRALGRRSPSDPGTHPPHLAPRQLPEGYRCLAGHSCIRSPSEKCKWLVVSTLSHSSGPGIEVSDSTGCRGPRRGECTLYGDPFCTEPINNPPGLLTDGDAVSCTGLAGNWTGWCLDAYRYLNDRKVTGCPPVDAVFDPGPPWFGNWTCVRSCADKGNYVSVRRVHTTVACMGPFSGGPACSWYSDANCTELAPGEPEPQPESPGFRYSGGITCAQTTEGWCGAAADVVIRNLTGPACNNTAVNGTSPGAFGEWICVRSCPDKANYVKVRSVGKDVMCLGTVGTYNASTKTYQGNACSCHGKRVLRPRPRRAGTGIRRWRRHGRLHLHPDLGRLVQDRRRRDSGGCRPLGPRLRHPPFDDDRRCCPDGFARAPSIHVASAGSLPNDAVGALGGQTSCGSSGFGSPGFGDCIVCDCGRLMHWNLLHCGDNTLRESRTLEQTGHLVHAARGLGATPQTESLIRGTWIAGD